jgi:hypothetical protein
MNFDSLKSVWTRIMSRGRGIEPRLTGLFLLVSLCPVAVAGYLAYQNWRTISEVNIGGVLERKAVRTATGIQKVLTDGRTSLDNWASLPVMYDLLADDLDGRIMAGLMTLDRESSGLGELLALSPSGTVVAASDPRRINERAGSTAWFQKLRDPNVADKSFELAELNAEDGKFYFSSRVTAKNQPIRVIGYLVVVLTRERLKP